MAALILCGSMVLTAAPDQVLDAEGHPALRKDLQVSEAGEKKVKALSSFAEALAIAKEKKKITPEVIDGLLECLRYDPNAAEPLQLLLSEWGKAKELKDCTERLLPLAQANPSALRLNVVTASVLKQSGRDAEACTLLEKSLDSLNEKSMQEQPFADLVLILSELYLDAGRWEDGDRLFSKAFELESWRNDFTLLRGALIFYGRASLAAPDNDGFWFLFSSSREHCKRLFEKTLTRLEDLCSKRYYPAGDFIPILEICRETGQAERGRDFILENILSSPSDINSLSFLATFYYEDGDYNNSLRLWQRIFHKNKLNPVYYYELGRSALRARQYRDAINAFEWFLISNPDHPGALYQMGLAYFEMHMYWKALSKFSKLESPEGLYMAAISHRELGQFVDAASCLERAEKLARENGREDFLNKEFYLSYAFICEKAGMLEKGTAPLVKILAANPQDDEVSNFLGYTWADNDVNLDQAEQFIRNALKVKPDEAAYLDSLAWLFFRKGKNKEALETIEKALKREDSIPDSVISDHAGDIFAAAGKMEKAIHYWSLALTNYSEDTNQDKIAAKITANGGTPPPYKKFK